MNGERDEEINAMDGIGRKVSYRGTNNELHGEESATIELWRKGQEK